MIPTIANLAGGGPMYIWTPSLPMPLLRPVTEAGLLDVWLVADLLAAIGVLAAAATAVREYAVAATLLALVAAVSLAATATGALLPLCYAFVYTAGLVLVRRARRFST